MGVVKLLAIIAGTIFIIMYVYTGLQATEHLLLRAAAHHQFTPFSRLKGQYPKNQAYMQNNPQILRKYIIYLKNIACTYTFTYEKT